MKPAILGVTSFFAGAAISAAVLAAGTAPAGGAINKEEVEKIVHAYILEHPDVIVDSVKKWQEGQSSRQTAAAKEVIKDKHDAIFNDDIDGYAGNPKGDVTVVEFFDYNCPACKMMFKGLDELVKKDKNVKIIFKEMPIFGEQSNKNSSVGIAVAKLAPEKYLAFHEGMMAHEGRITPEAAIAIGVGLGLKESDIKEEMEKDYVAKQIQQNHLLADELGVRGTPALIIGDELIPSAIDYNTLKTQIENLRKK